MGPGGTGQSQVAGGWAVTQAKFVRPAGSQSIRSHHRPPGSPADMPALGFDASGALMNAVVDGAGLIRPPRDPRRQAQALRPARACRLAA